MKCSYIKYDTFYSCEYCGELRNEPLDVECKVPRNPSTIKRISNFLPAVTKYGFAGRRCTQDEIDSRFSICKTCPLFKCTSGPVDDPSKVRGVCSHNSCGCNIRDDNVFMNKLAWNTEQCPVGKWTMIE